MKNIEDLQWHAATAMQQLKATPTLPRITLNE